IHSKTYSKILLRLLRNIHRDFFPLLDASAKQLPFLITPVLQRALTFFPSGKRVALMLVPQFNYMYSFTGMRDFPKRHVAALAYADQAKRQARLMQASSVAEILALVAFPMVEAELALTWGVLVHELGHLIDFVEELYSKIPPLKLDQQSFDKF